MSQRYYSRDDQSLSRKVNRGFVLGLVELTEKNSVINLIDPGASNGVVEVETESSRLSILVDLPCEH